MSFIATMTPEYREQMLELANIARAKKRADREANIHNLKLEWLDDPYWAGLASKYNVRMPNAADKVTAGLITKYLKRVNIPREDFVAHLTGFSYFTKNNPTVGAYAMVGHLLEIRESMAVSRVN